MDSQIKQDQRVTPPIEDTSSASIRVNKINTLSRTRHPAKKTGG